MEPPLASSPKWLYCSRNNANQSNIKQRNRNSRFGEFFTNPFSVSPLLNIVAIEQSKWDAGFIEAIQHGVQTGRHQGGIFVERSVNEGTTEINYSSINDTIVSVAAISRPGSRRSLTNFPHSIFLFCFCPSYSLYSVRCLLTLAY